MYPRIQRATAKVLYNIHMEHYVCTGGCKGVSGKPGVCQEKTCPKYGKPLDRCECADGLHAGVVPTPPNAEREPEEKAM